MDRQKETKNLENIIAEEVDVKATTKLLVMAKRLWGCKDKNDSRSLYIHRIREALRDARDADRLLLEAEQLKFDEERLQFDRDHDKRERSRDRKWWGTTALAAIAIIIAILATKKPPTIIVQPQVSVTSPAPAPAGR